MGSQRSLLLLFVAFLLLGFVSSYHVSNEGLEAQGSTVSRSLQQQETRSCRIADSLNYTLLTSQCKGPNYTVERCCVPLKKLLCAIHRLFNDLTIHCADVFFCNVDYYGKYPLGLFARMCREGKEGLDCHGFI